MNLFETSNPKEIHNEHKNKNAPLSLDMSVYYLILLNRTIGVNLGLPCSRRLGRAEQKGRCGCAKYCEIRPVGISTQKRSETQLQTVSVAETTKTLGFTMSLLDAACMEKPHFSMAFHGFDSFRSTQPTML